MSTEQKLPITVCIPVKNEEKNLLHCLNSLSDSFEAVVVIDSSSTDQTKQIALDHGATYINFEWNGKYPKKRNWLLHNHPIQTPWVFFLDADERLTPEFIKEIRETIFETEHSGFWLAYDNWFMHRLLKHGDVFSKLALFQRNSLRVFAAASTSRSTNTPSSTDRPGKSTPNSNTTNIAGSNTTSASTTITPVGKPNASSTFKTPGPRCGRTSPRANASNTKTSINGGWDSSTS
ncbi:MAG: glycosyltransferase [Phycisphaeraceae bacterium]